MKAEVQVSHQNRVFYGFFPINLKACVGSIGSALAHDQPKVTDLDGKLRRHGIWSVLVPVDVMMVILLILLNFESKSGVTIADSGMKVEAVAFTALLTVGLLAPFAWRWWLDLKKPPAAPVEVKVEN